MYNKLTNGMRLAGAIKPALVFSSVLILSACVAKDPDGGSSSAAVSSAPESSSSIVQSSSIAMSSSSAMESSSVMVSSSSSVMSSSSVVVSSSSEVSSAEASSEMSSSSEDNSGGMLGKIIPRTECPKPPAILKANGGDWQANYATAEYPFLGNNEAEADAVPRFKDYMLEQTPFDTGEIELAWNMHEPDQASNDNGELYPLVIYLHGGAERGEGSNPEHLNNRHAKNFFASTNSLLTDDNLENRPAYIVAPFCDYDSKEGCKFSENEWSSGGGRHGWGFQPNPSKSMAAVIGIIEELIETKKVDPARIYVTGASMGGGGSWELAARRPDLIAVAMPLAGLRPDKNALQKIIDNKVVMWSHHGIRDNNNEYSGAKEGIGLVASGGGCAWQTTYHPSSDLSIDDPADGDPSDAIHNIWPRAYTYPGLWDWVFSVAQPREGEVIGGHSSSKDSSSSHGSSSSVASGDVLAANNHYDAPKASIAPVIDGEVDAVWANASWMRMDVAWTGFENLTTPSSDADFNGKYKAMWDQDYLYLLFDITDDVINTDGQYYQQDTVELFIDEDQSGGQHNQSYNAFAYHISHNLVVEDNGGDNYKTHITAAINTEGTRHMWEVRVKIFAEHNGYVPSQEAAARIKLAAGKVMGFTPSYIDNDGNGNREHFMSSVDTPGHQDNQGYLNADSFGSIMLVE